MFTQYIVGAQSFIQYNVGIARDSSGLSNLLQAYVNKVSSKYTHFNGIHLTAHIGLF